MPCSTYRIGHHVCQSHTRFELQPKHTGHYTRNQMLRHTFALLSANHNRPTYTLRTWHNQGLQLGPLYYCCEPIFNG